MIELLVISGIEGIPQSLWRRKHSGRKCIDAARVHVDQAVADAQLENPALAQASLPFTEERITIAIDIIEVSDEERGIVGVRDIHVVVDQVSIGPECEGAVVEWQTGCCLVADRIARRMGRSKTRSRRRRRPKAKVVHVMIDVHVVGVRRKFGPTPTTGVFKIGDFGIDALDVHRQRWVPGSPGIVVPVTDADLLLFSQAQPVTATIRACRSSPTSAVPTS